MMVQRLSNATAAQFQNYGVQKYRNDYDPDHHVKACFSDPDVSVLWETGHCHHTTGEPLLSLQPFKRRILHIFLGIRQEVSY